MEKSPIRVTLTVHCKNMKAPKEQRRKFDQTMEAGYWQLIDHKEAIKHDNQLVSTRTDWFRDFKAGKTRKQIVKNTLKSAHVLLAGTVLGCAIAILILMKIKQTLAPDTEPFPLDLIIYRLFDYGVNYPLLALLFTALIYETFTSWRILPACLDYCEMDRRLGDFCRYLVLARNGDQRHGIFIRSRGYPGFHGINLSDVRRPGLQPSISRSRRDSRDTVGMETMGKGQTASAIEAKNNRHFGSVNDCFSRRQCRDEFIHAEQVPRNDHRRHGSFGSGRQDLPGRCSVRQFYLRSGSRGRKPSIDPSLDHQKQGFSLRFVRRGCCEQDPEKPNPKRRCDHRGDNHQQMSDEGG